MIINTNAIVLKTFSYSETSLISRCFTEGEGKISFIIKGAKSKKFLVTPYFQPLSYINVIYKKNINRELQIISKVSFAQIWSKIPMSLKKMALAQSMLEVIDYTLEENDSHPNLFKSLIKILYYFEKGDFEENILFWYFECKVLSELGFMIDINDDETVNNSISLDKKSNSYFILQNLINEQLFDLKSIKISTKDRKMISKFLYHKLCFYFEGFENLKSFSVIKDIFVKDQNFN